MLSAPFSYLTAGSVESPSFHRRTTTLLTNFERNFEKEEGENSGHTHTQRNTGGNLILLSIRKKTFLGWLREVGEGDGFFAKQK